MLKGLFLAIVACQDLLLLSPLLREPFDIDSAKTTSEFYMEPQSDIYDDKAQK